MKLKFSPFRSDVKLEASVSGSVLILNGEPLDFSDIPEGASAPLGTYDTPWIRSDVMRVGGEICLTLAIPHGVDAPQETLFPANFDTFLTVRDWQVPIPAYDMAHG